MRVLTPETPGTIPVDSLRVARKVMPLSEGMLEGHVRDAASELGLGSFEVTQEETIILRLLGEVEYAAKKPQHPRLAVRSVIDLSNRFNQWGKGQRITDYTDEAQLGPADWYDTTDGEFVAGFTFEGGQRDHFFVERWTAVNKVLDLAGFAPDDPLREWGADDADTFWLPMVTIQTADPDAPEAIADFCANLTERTASLTIDLFEARAKAVAVEVPLSVFPSLNIRG